MAHSYSLALNPNEPVWNVIKGQVAGRFVVEDEPTLRRLVRSTLRVLQHPTGSLKWLFHKPKVAYIISERWAVLPN